MYISKLVNYSNVHLLPSVEEIFPRITLFYISREMILGKSATYVRIQEREFPFLSRHFSMVVVTFMQSLS